MIFLLFYVNSLLIMIKLNMPNKWSKRLTITLNINLMQCGVMDLSIMPPIYARPYKLNNTQHEYSSLCKRKTNNLLALKIPMLVFVSSFISQKSMDLLRHHWQIIWLLGPMHSSTLPPMSQASTPFISSYIFGIWPMTPPFGKGAKNPFRVILCYVTHIYVKVIKT